MPKLLNIKLDDNHIQIWNPEWFKNTHSLSRISMQNNIIEELPANAFKNIRSVKKYGNPIINFVFDTNKIKYIDPKAFSGLEKIRNLWLDNNLLEDFNENVLNGITIDSLRLNNNKIKCFKGNLAKILKANMNVIDSNPFECDCLQNIKEWSKGNKRVDIFIAELNCLTEAFNNNMANLKKILKDLNENTQKTKNGKMEIADTEFVLVKNNHRIKINF